MSLLEENPKNKTNVNRERVLNISQHVHLPLNLGWKHYERDLTIIERVKVYKYTNAMAKK